MVLLLLGACAIDAGLATKDGVPGRFDSGDGSGTDTATSTTLPDEVCDGDDDDADGAIDEGWPDTDGDGVADCVDDACALALAPAGEVPVSPVCDGTFPWAPPANLGEMQVEWARGTGQSFEVPVVGRLRDTDGDGDVDGDDLPDILIVDLPTRRLLRYRGDGADEVVLANDVLHASTTLADVDGDGVMDLFTVRASTAEVCRLDATGAERWCSPDVHGNGGGTPVVADLDGDGALEVVGIGGVLDAVTGTLEAIACTLPFGMQPAVGDVDGDGAAEILCGRQLSDLDGGVRWDLATSLEEVATATFVDVDLDGVPEILASDLQYGLSLLSAEGAELAVVRDPGSVWSAPCVADVDGDGDAEIAVAHDQAVNLYDGALTRLWRFPATDISGDASCGMFDFDADGAAEIVYAGEDALVLLRGDGTELGRWSDHRSGTGLEFPAVADVDLDGAAELVVPQNTTAAGVVVLGQDGPGWAPADPWWPDGWGVPGRFTPDGRPAPTPAVPWAGGGRSHAQQVGVWDPATGTWSTLESRPDLVVSVADVCVASCEVPGRVEVAVAVENRGPVDTLAEVVLVRVDATGETELGRTTVSLPAGRRLEDLAFTSDRDAEIAWRATVRSAEGLEDCDPTSDTDEHADRVCP